MCVRWLPVLGCHAIQVSGVPCAMCIVAGCLLRDQPALLSWVGARESEERCGTEGIGGCIWVRGWFQLEAQGAHAHVLRSVGAGSLRHGVSAAASGAVSDGIKADRQARTQCVFIIIDSAIKRHVFKTKLSFRHHRPAMAGTRGFHAGVARFYCSYIVSCVMRDGCWTQRPVARFVS